jgi:hypothetical protein
MKISTTSTVPTTKSGSQDQASAATTFPAGYWTRLADEYHRGSGTDDEEQRR